MPLGFSPSNFSCFRLQRSGKLPPPKRVVLKCQSHCFTKTPPETAKRLVTRLVCASVCIQICVAFGPPPTGWLSFCPGNVPLSILSIKIINRTFVVSPVLGLRLDSKFRMNAAQSFSVRNSHSNLTAEKGPVSTIRGIKIQRRMTRNEQRDT